MAIGAVMGLLLVAVLRPLSIPTPVVSAPLGEGALLLVLVSEPRRRRATRP